MKKVIDKLESFIKLKTQEEEATYAEWYKKSKLYEAPTLEDVFGECIASDIEEFQTALALNENISYYVEHFEEKARLYGSSWFDKDLNRWRSGYEFESGVYAYLQKLASEACSLEEV